MRDGTNDDNNNDNVENAPVMTILKVIEKSYLMFDMGSHLVIIYCILYKWIFTCVKVFETAFLCVSHTKMFERP